MSKYCKKINSIISGLQKGDLSKQQALFDATANHLRQIAMKYADDKKDCDDILQVAYMRAFEYIASADTGKDGYNWLCKIVQNVAYDFRKKAENHVIFEPHIPSEPFIPTDSIEERKDLEGEMEKLGEEDRKLLYMKFWEDLSYQQIAEKTNSKKSTVHKRVTALMTQIKQNLGEF